MSLRSVFLLALVAAAPLSPRSQAQQISMTAEAQSGQTSSGSSGQMPGMPGMQQPHSMNKNNASPQTLIAAIQQHASSGTSAEPNSTPADMLMTRKGGWMLMLHGEAFLNALQQSGPRGDDKFFSTNWVMPMAQHSLGPGTITLRTMLSLEPATVSHRFYPELFQQGETAYGKPIVDGQHPHEFVMELAALYDIGLGEHGLLSFYLAPVGDPAMGPTAYPHRASASEDPIASLGHHLEDSTHIANDVITAGLTYKIARLEASGFHGREPDEYRWDIDSGKINSWSLRATLNPAQNWSGQFSFGHLTSPEALHPAEDIDRTTASVMYNRPLARGNWATTLLWGRNHTSDGLNWNGYLAESTVRFAQDNYLWARIENTDRTNELLLRNQAEPANFSESVAGRVQAYSAGYERDFHLIPHLATGLGGQLTWYSTPSTLAPLYDKHPLGAILFLRLRPES